MALYTAEFSKRLESLKMRMDNGELTDRSYRLLNIHLALKEHLGRYKERPKNEDLAALTAMILYEELSDKHPDKMTREEYPFMSDSQEGVRERKHRPHDDLQFEGRIHNGRRKTSFTDDYGAPQVRNNRMLGFHDGEMERVVSYLDLYDALDNGGLTERQREAIDLVYFYNMTQGEAAEVMGIGQDVVSRSIKVSLYKLKKYLTSQCHILID